MQISLIPKSIYGRFLLMILLPIIIIQIVTIVIFYERHWENVSNNMKNYLVSEVKTIVNYYIKHKEHKQVLKDLNQLDVNILLLENYKTHAKITDTILEEFEDKLKRSITYKLEVFYINEKSEIRMLIFLATNKILKIDVSTKRIKNPTTYIFVLWIVTTSILFGLISLFFMKNQVKSILKLTKAAKDFGQGKIYRFVPSGAMEIRSLGLSFLKMRKNIERQIRYRTELLNHIAHDLRTPITRIKLKLALLEKSHNMQSIDKEINIIEKMIKSYLDFAKQEGNEKGENRDLVLLIKDIISVFNNKCIHFESSCDNLEIHLKAVSIERALTNVIDNALKHTKTLVNISLFGDEEKVIIEVDDDGPGIAEKNYKAVFEPFNKIGSSKEGYGLGFAIAKNIISAHGGKISLAKNEYDGLKVAITLPR